MPFAAIWMDLRDYHTNWIQMRTNIIWYSLHMDSGKNIQTDLSTNQKETQRHREKAYGNQRGRQRTGISISTLCKYITKKDQPYSAENYTWHFVITYKGNNLKNNIHIYAHVCIYMYTRACSVTQLCPTLCDPVDYCSLPGSSVHGIFQARILEWVVRQEYWSGLPFSPLRDLSNSGIQPESCSSCIGRWTLYHLGSPLYASIKNHVTNSECPFLAISPK